MAAGVAVIGVLIAATITVLVVLREESLKTAEWHVDNLATALAEQSWQSMHTIEVLGRTTADEIQDRLAQGRPLPDPAIAARLQERVQGTPAVRMLAFIDATGKPVMHVPAAPTDGVSFFDREHFQAQRERRIEGLFIGRPIYGVLVPEWLDVFTMRVEGARGDFRGVVSIAVAMSYFQRLFEAIDLGKDGSVQLFRADGVLLASYPAVEKAYGRSFADDALFAQSLRKAGSGVDRRPGMLDDQKRIVAYRKLVGYPLVVAVSSSEAFFLSAWRGNAWGIGFGALAACGILAGALFFLLRQLGVSAALEHDLRETDERLHSIIDSAMDAIITVDDSQRVLLFNSAAERIFQCPAREAIGGPLDRFIPERFRAAHRRHVAHFAQTGATTRAMGGRLALFGRKADGSEFPIDASISQVSAEGRKFYTVILRDITERVNAEQALERSYAELRELSAAMNEVRETERTRIARELHDELAQWLTALKMDVSWMATRLPRDQTPLIEKAEKMKQVVDTTVSSVRRIAADLRPVMLDDLGLVPAVEGLLHALSERSAIVVSLEADAEALDYGEPLATSLYRMVQEALTNVGRHAEAREAGVTMGFEGEDLVVRVRDDGKGYDAEAAARRKSYGIMGIRERAQTLGGRASVVRLERGTLVEIRIPAARYRKRGEGHDTGAAG